jgi:hypothetical protein
LTPDHARSASRSGTARVARVDGRVGLQHVLEVRRVGRSASAAGWLARHHAGRRRELHAAHPARGGVAEPATTGFALLDRARVAQLERRRARAVLDAHDREVLERRRSRRSRRWRIGALDRRRATSVAPLTTWKFVTDEDLAALEHPAVPLPSWLAGAGDDRGRSTA